MALCLFERNSFYRYRFTIHNRGDGPKSPCALCSYRRITPMTF
nr:MAG TPA: hypothetical protein [Caudoviricetes sp.]